ncbi:hypothetical protein EIP86_003301 [Pleurotus ostreatoroseus]|nr:hypothetical protein EIP86_003301 [Pleurotus ostreatoroseus]
MPRRLPTRRGPPSRQPLQEEPANETPSDEEEIPTLHTGIRTTTADLDMNQHTRSSVRPYVVQDLKDAIKVDLYSWIEAVLGISSERIETWTSQIAENKWFDDGIIQQHLKKYCEASTEPHRYQPFCELAGRILELARGCLDGIDRTNSYPVDSVQFINTSKRQVVRIPEHGLLGAERLLDITMTYGEAAEEFLKTNKIHWRDILHFVELKRSTSLVVALDKEKQRRARSSIPVSVPPTTAQETQTDSPTSQDSNDDVPTGSKRPRESDDDDSSVNKVPRGIPNETEGVEQSGSSLLLDDKLSLHYYDACGIIQTRQHLSLLQDFEKTAAIFVALASCSLEQFGIMPTSIIKTPTPYIKPPHKFTDSHFTIKHPISKEPLQVTLVQSLYAQYVSSGRRTFAYTIKALPQLSDKSLMVKFSYQVVTRKPEYDLIKIARKAGVGHLPDVHAWADIWRMSEGLRRVLLETMTKEERGRQEDRMLRMIVYTEYESIKSLFSRRCDLIPVMVEQMATCLHDLRYKANMLHRDISVNNIMVRMQDDRYHFILNDFDMAVVLPKDKKTPYVPSSKHRAGTWAFMAVALLQDANLHKDFDGDAIIPTKHLLCHDLESLFWVSLYCVLTLFLEEVPPKRRDGYLANVKGWETSKASHIKQTFCTVSLKKTIPSLPPSAMCLEAWLSGWTRLCSKASTTKLEHEHEHTFDEETVGGTFTRDTILGVLTPLMPFRQTGDETGSDIEEKEQDAEESIPDAEKEVRDEMQRGVKANQMSGKRRSKKKGQGEAQAQGEGKVQRKDKGTGKAKGKERAQEKTKAEGTKKARGKQEVQRDAEKDPVSEFEQARSEKDEDEGEAQARGKKRKGKRNPRKGTKRSDTTKTNDKEESHEPSTSQASAVAVPAVITKRQSRKKTVTVEAEAVKAAVMSKLRPRKAP